MIEFGLTFVLCCFGFMIIIVTCLIGYTIFKQIKNGDFND